MAFSFQYSAANCFDDVMKCWKFVWRLVQNLSQHPCSPVTPQPPKKKKNKIKYNPPLERHLPRKSEVIKHKNTNAETSERLLLGLR
ncbi:hypothetical protein I7I53_06084 [Histoplasma capsulatum var. duboisii H88]|uniref:Uncharacterized protein n=1 Tax=Ajellomyces capsulatus (strain H88) TaxID=544711 RepID=A0A8A1LB94_AJEC8|nr:hypothetical protein I7I53_06084 [Histoplasma capsulatum var. duboisii H88]